MSANSGRIGPTPPSYISSRTAFEHSRALHLSASVPNSGANGRLIAVGCGLQSHSQRRKRQTLPHGPCGRATVVLESPKDIALFHRIIHSKPRPIFFTDQAMVVTCVHNDSSPEYQILDTLAACAGLGVLVFPSSHRPFTISSRCSYDRDRPHPSSLRHRQSVVPPLITNSNSLTHLRFCEPSNVWRLPSSSLVSFGPLPHLSRFQFSRRADANSC